MPEPDVAPPLVYVQPGETHLVSGTVILKTVLGSCVGVTFWVPRLDIAALCHPMLPRFPVKPPPDMNITAGRRYVDFAIRDVAERLNKLNVRRSEVQVKLFGGGDVLLVPTTTSRPSVGRLNCEAAIKTLESEGFKITASSLGSCSGVNIMFHTGTGEVLLQRLGGDENCSSKGCGRKQAAACAVRRNMAKRLSSG